MKFNQSGQAAVEYILLLIVAIAIGQAVWQMNSAFRNWAQNYYVAYFQCLLETGELPGLGGEVAAGICNESYQPFSWQAGRPPVGNQSASGGSGGAAGGVGNNDSSTPTATAGGETASDPNRFAAGGSSSRRNGSRAGSPFPANNDGTGRGSIASKKPKQKKLYTGSDQVSSPGSLKSGDEARTSSLRTRNASGIKSSYYEEERGQERSVLKTNRKEREEKAKKGELIPVKRKLATNDAIEAETEMTFGTFIRILIIAAIIIALLFLIGGQLLQVSKEL